MTFERLTLGDAIAWVAALALLLCTAVDWYSTVGGNEARQTQHSVDPSSLQGQLGGEVPRTIEKQAALAAQADEKNIWQEKRAYDRLELAVLLAVALSASAAAVLRTAGHQYTSWLTPSAVAALLAALGALMVLYRVVQQPGDDQVTVLKSGPWLAFVALGVVGFGASLASRSERDGTAQPTPPSSDPPPAPQPHAAQTP